MLDFLSNIPQMGWIVILVLGLAIIYLVGSGRLKVKKSKDGEFLLGDDTPFEKTNQRFKDLCKTVHDMNDKQNMCIVPTLSKLERWAKEDYMNIQKLLMTDEQLPMDERIHAGDNYIKEGGNGFMKSYYERILKPQVDIRVDEFKEVK